MSIVHIADIDIARALAALPDIEHAWADETWRQELRFSPHRDTQTIFLRRQPGNRPRDVLHQLASVATQHYCNDALAWVVHQVCALVSGRPARAMLVKLAPGGRVEPHTDIGIYADATERVHVPLITNDGAWIEASGQRFHLPVGGVYTLDKHAEHSAGNDGTEPRLHMIVDVHPDSPEILAG